MRDLRPTVPVPARRIAPALALAALAGSAAAQGGAAFTAASFEPDWPDFPPKLYTRTVAGEFTGDLDADAFVIADGVPAMLVTPEAYRTFVQVPYPAEDVDVLRAMAGEDRDWLVSVGPDGLVRYAWSDLDDDFRTEVLESSQDWREMVHVRVGDVDGDGHEDLVALSSSPDTELRILYGDGAGGFGSETVLQTALPARRFELVDWQGDGPLELCAVTAWGLEVYDRFGVPVADEPWSWSDIVIAVVDQLDVPYQRVVAIVQDANGVDFAVVRDQTGMSAPAALGALGIVELAAGDFDRDGYDDVAASITSAPEMVVLFNQADDGGVPDFSMQPGASFVLPFGDPARDVSGNLVRPAVRDFDHDGDQDVLFPVHDEGRIELLPNTAIDAEARKVVFTRGDYFWDQPAATGFLQLTLDQPGFLPVGVTDVELVVWKEAGFGLGTQPVAFDEEYYPVTGTWPLGVWFETGEPNLYFTTIYSIELRLVKRVQGTVVEKHAAYTTTYTQDWQTAQDLATLPGAGDVTIVEITTIPFDPGDVPIEVLPTQVHGQQSEEVSAGGLTDLPEVPDFPDDFVPDRPEDEGGG